MRRMQNCFIISLCFGLAVVGTGRLLAQQNSAKPTEPAPPPPRGIGILHITPAPSQRVSTLKDLCAKSDLILTGTAVRTFESRESRPGALETDALIMTDRILKGSLHNAPQIIVSQSGGSRPQYKIKPAQYSLIQPGNEYILFLTEDSRSIPTPVMGTSRYLVTGVWSGLFKFDNGSMVVTADESDPLRRQYVGLKMDQIIKEITTAMQER